MYEGWRRLAWLVPRDRLPASGAVLPPTPAGGLDLAGWPAWPCGQYGRGHDKRQLGTKSLIGFSFCQRFATRLCHAGTTYEATTMASAALILAASKDPNAIVIWPNDEGGHNGAFLHGGQNGDLKGMWPVVVSCKDMDEVRDIAKAFDVPGFFEEGAVPKDA